MKLLMYLDKDLVDCAHIDYRQVVRPGYLGQIKRELQKKHTALLKQVGSEPEFILIRASGSSKSGK